MNVQSKLHPVILGQLAALGLIVCIPEKFVPVYAIEALGMNLMGADDSKIKWSVFCQVWRVIALLESARQEHLASDPFGIDPLDQVQEMMADYDNNTHETNPEMN